MKVISMNFVKPTRIEICKKLMEESSNIITLMQAIKAFSKKVIDTETLRMSSEGLQGEVANDPENLRKRAIALYSEICELNKAVEANNHLLEMDDDVALLIAHLIDDCEHLTFDPEVFGINPKDFESEDSERESKDEEPDCDGDCGHCESYTENTKAKDEDMEAFKHLKWLLGYLEERM